jgi:hypothetical protein
MSTAQKISELTTAGPLTGAELVPVVQNSGTLQTTVSVLKAYAVVSIEPEISALNTRIDQVSALVSSEGVAIASLAADVAGALVVVASLSAAVSSLAVRVDDVSAIATSIGVVVATYDTLISDVSAAVVSVNAVVSALDSQIVQVQASISAINSVLATIDTSAIAGLEVRVSDLSIAVSANTAAITSVNAVVSALDIRLTAVSASVSVNSAAITSINAVVSLKAFRNGDFLTNVQYIDFNTTTSYAPSPGRLTWDTQLGTLDLGLKGTVNLPVGQRQVIQVFNNSGVTLPVNKVVRLNGASNGRPTAALAQANSDANSQNTIGIMLETVSASSTGYVATSGVVRSFDTNPYTDGAFLWLSPVSAGELTATKPTALTGRAVEIGIVVKANPFGISQGALVLNLREGYDLNELHNVYVSTTASLADGEVLAWNASASVWTNSTALTATQASVSVLQLQVNAVSVALTSTNNVVSALEIRVSAASATGATNSAAITSINAVLVSILAILPNPNYRVTE